MLRHAVKTNASCNINYVKTKMRFLGGTSTFSSDFGKAKESKESGIKHSVQSPPANKEKLSGKSDPSVYPSWFEKMFNFWNESSGTAEISNLKDEVAHASKEFDTATREVTESRREVDKKLLAYEEVHGRHASMLRVRDQWDDKDASEFAELIGKEVSTRKELEKAREDMQKAEVNVAKWQVEYMDAMRKRYHEEQIWQDKWRVFGTYGTWTLIGLNSIVFLGSQYFHNRREVGRIKAIESLINEKLPLAELDKGAMASDKMKSDKKDENGQDREIQNDTKQNSECSLVGENQSIIKEKEDVDQSKLMTSQISSDNATSEDDSAPAPNANHIGWFEHVKGMLLLPVRNHNEGKKLSGEKENIPNHELSFFTYSKHALESIHFPSAAVGAAVTASVFMFASALVKR